MSRYALYFVPITKAYLCPCSTVACCKCMDQAACSPAPLANSSMAKRLHCWNHGPAIKCMTPNRVETNTQCSRHPPAKNSMPGAFSKPGSASPSFMCAYTSAMYDRGSSGKSIGFRKLMPLSCRSVSAAPGPISNLRPAGHNRTTQAHTHLDGHR